MKTPCIIILSIESFFGNKILVCLVISQKLIYPNIYQCICILFLSLLSPCTFDSLKPQNKNKNNITTVLVDKQFSMNILFALYRLSPAELRTQLRCYRILTLLHCCSSFFHSLTSKLTHSI